MDDSPVRAARSSTTSSGEPTPSVASATHSTPGAIVALAAIVAIGAWLRLRAIPGPWGTDALGYVERALGTAGGAADTRSQRVVFLGMIRAALALGDGSPAAASVPGVVLSALVGPVLYLAARRRAGPWLALLPAALWAVLGLDIEEVVEVSADAATALPGAFVALALAAAVAKPEAARRWIVAAGIAVGAGFVVKETAAFAAAGLVVGALLLVPGRKGIVHAATAAGAAASVVALAAAAGFLQRLDVASHEMAVVAAPVRWDAPGFVERVVLGVPAMLLTSTGAFGLLFVAALPLVVRVVFRAARGDAVAVAAVAALVAFDLAPISFSTWTVLPTTFPRYILGVVPIWLVAMSDALAESPSHAWEWRVALVAAAAGLVFVGRWAPTWWVVPIGLALTSWTCLPAAWRARAARFEAGRFAAVFLVAATASSLLTPWARTRPDATWTAWSVLPRDGAIHADRVVGRRLALAARSAPAADRTRLLLLDDDPPAAAALAPGDLVLVRRGTRLAAACAARGDLVPWTADLGETLVLVRR